MADHKCALPVMGRALFSLREVQVLSGVGKRRQIEACRHASEGIFHSRWLRRTRSSINPINRVMRLHNIMYGTDNR